MPLTRYFPYGRSWLYDVQRFSNTRNFNVIFDGGANIGQTAVELCRYFPSGSIFCFEPVSATFCRLRENNKGNKNVTCVQTALGNERGSAEIALYDDSELNTLVLNSPRKSTGEREVVSIDTIDGFCRDRKLASIDLLKLDVQG
jgi:FkbM family methyltransferase